MALEHKTTDELVRIALAGGGFHLDASRRTTDDLVRIAQASRETARLVFYRLGGRKTDDLVRISIAGKGAVQFRDDQASNLVATYEAAHV